MRILLNDFGGYAFAAQLGRQLAKLGESVVHCYCNSLSTTPNGNVCNEPDLANYKVHPIELAEPMQKYSFVKRRSQEIEYGKKVSSLVAEIKPDVVVSANTPLDSLHYIWSAADRHAAKKVFWLQDVIGLAAWRILSKKIPVLGSIIGRYYINLEQRLLRASELVLPISTAFGDYLERARVSSNKISVLENWAPIEEIPLLPRDNPWARKHQLVGRLVVLYSGTLSMKHDPSHILEIARAVETVGGQVIVRSQGLGADWLKSQKTGDRFSNLIVDGYVPYSDLPASLASADVLLALLEPDAAQYSVPSKVLTYLSAGKAIVLIAPASNLAARKINQAQAGIVVEPDNTGDLFASIQNLVSNQAQLDAMGRNARSFAEREFDIQRIGQDFRQLLLDKLST